MDENKRLEAFRAAVLENSRQKAQAITDSAQSEADAYLKALTDEETVSFARQKAEIENEVSLRLQRESAGQELSAKRAVLSYREELIGEVFEKAQAILTKKAASPEHENYVFSCLKRISAQYKGENGICLLSPAHMSYADKIKSDFGYECKSDDSLTLGGVMVRFDRLGILIDNSVNSALDKQRADFAGNNSSISV